MPPSLLSFLSSLSYSLFPLLSFLFSLPFLPPRCIQRARVLTWTTGPASTESQDVLGALVKEGLDLGGKDEKGGGEAESEETITIMAAPLQIKKDITTSKSFRSTTSSFSSGGGRRTRGTRLAPVAVVEVLRRLGKDDLRDAYSEYDAKILNTFTTIGATALSNAKMREEAEKARRKGNLVSEVLSVLSHSKGTNSLILAIMGKIRDIMNVERCTVFVLVSEGRLKEEPEIVRAREREIARDREAEG